jgi:hypothetical protein
VCSGEWLWGVQSSRAVQAGKLAELETILAWRETGLEEIQMGAVPEADCWPRVAFQLVRDSCVVCSPRIFCDAKAEGCRKNGTDTFLGARIVYTLPPP